MHCRKAQQLISVALDEPLTEYDRIRLGRHLESCPGCLRQREVLLKGRELLTAGLESPPENFEWKVQLGIQRALRAGAAAAESSPPPRRFWLPAASSAIAVASVVVVAGVLWLTGPAGDGTPEFGQSAEQHAQLDSRTVDLRAAERTELPAIPVYAQPGYGVQEASSRYRPVRGVGLHRFVDGTAPARGFSLVDDSHALRRELNYYREENARLRRAIEAGHSRPAALPADSAGTAGPETEPR